MKRDALKDLAGQDRIVGRPIRLNQKKLKVKLNKDYAEMIFWGDLHYGHPECDDKRAKEMLEWALDNKVYVLGMGDYIECGTRPSVGDSVYQQKLNPHKQMDTVVEWLEPLANEGLLLGIHTGNHEFRITQTTSIDVTKIMAKQLRVSYLGYAIWNLFSINGHKYTIYSNHGSSGSKFKHTKIKAIMDLTQWIHADCIAMGHVHSLAAEPVLIQRVDKGNRQVIEDTCYVVLTGSFLTWDKSYAQMKNMPITKLGSPKVKIYANKHDMKFSL